MEIKTCFTSVVKTSVIRDNLAHSPLFMANSVLFKKGKPIKPKAKRPYCKGFYWSSKRVSNLRNTLNNILYNKEFQMLDFVSVIIKK